MQTFKLVMSIIFLIVGIAGIFIASPITVLSGFVMAFNLFYLFYTSKKPKDKPVKKSFHFKKFNSFIYSIYIKPAVMSKGKMIEPPKAIIKRGE